MSDEALAAVAKALAHPARIRILRLLARQTECRGSDVFAELPLAQSTVSQHLAVLKDAGLVMSHAVGQSSVYCLAPDVVRSFAGELDSIVASSPACSAQTEECR